ncbi:MFS transporter [Azorhizobium oxalatiphilum]|uniref:MFS transporter n=1 Tax=Azorhizobium oxalatiphilum TaxID=980631 RepID=A0A917FJT5_9HYPH|nr:MFS transporter [Azorhizobium oxalatiphilum]GGF86852.1 MFS transporter [Azorhizobium oxalatiphilum]
MTAITSTSTRRKNTPAQVLTASLIGTTIEFYDFYIYATAAVLVFPALFFPGSDPMSALLASFATFSIAFFARPLGAIVFGHFGDRIGRKVTLVTALLTMGISTVTIGFLPGYHQIGVMAPLLLALCRFGQGFGLGGEWGGAVLLATENAPEGKRNWYGMFPQFGAPLGLFLASGSFWVLLHYISPEAFRSWGWRIPFIASILLIAIGMWVRLSITETPEFKKALEKKQRADVPLVELFRNHKRGLFLGTFMALATFVVFYLCTAYLLSYNVSVLKISFLEALKVQIYGSALFGLTVVISGKLGDRFGRNQMLAMSIALTALFSFSFPFLLSGSIEKIYIFCTIGMLIFGINYGLIGTALAAPFPTHVRYTGSSMTFNLAGIVGASLAPYIATWLNTNYGLPFVGYYLLVASLISLACVFALGMNNKQAN